MSTAAIPHSTHAPHTLHGAASAPLERLYIALRFCYGLVPVVAGLDKFTNLLTHWDKYLPASAASLLPMSPGAFMRVVGVIEIVAGLAVLTLLPRLGAWVVAAWLVLIAVAVAIAGYYDIAVRDLVMSLGAIALATLAAHRGQPLVPFKS